MRERDIRNAIAGALTETSEFSSGGVWITGLPEDAGEPANESAAVAIEPIATKEDDSWDAAAAGGLVLTCQIKITVLYRGSDIQLRDEGAERLLAVAMNAVNANGLGGLVFPQKSRITGWQWLPSTTPERRIAVTYSCQYLVEGWDNFDTSE